MSFQALQELVALPDEYVCRLDKQLCSRNSTCSATVKNAQDKTFDYIACQSSCCFWFPQSLKLHHNNCSLPPSTKRSGCPPVLSMVKMNLSLCFRSSKAPFHLSSPDRRRACSQQADGPCVVSA